MIIKLIAELPILIKEIIRNPAYYAYIDPEWLKWVFSLDDKGDDGGAIMWHLKRKIAAMIVFYMLVVTTTVIIIIGIKHIKKRILKKKAAKAPYEFESSNDETERKDGQ